MTAPWQHRTLRVLRRVMEERERQVARYGHNTDLEDGTGPETRWLGPYTEQPATQVELTLRRDYLEFEEETGKPTWVHLIREEVAEAFCESDPERLKEEVLQVAALCVSWLEKLDARASQSAIGSAYVTRVCRNLACGVVTYSAARCPGCGDHTG